MSEESPMHISLLASAHVPQEPDLVRAELAAVVLDVWRMPGIVYALPLLDLGKCGLLTLWAGAAAFEDWRRRPRYRTLQRLLFRLCPEHLYVFDCPLGEIDVAEASSPRSLSEAFRFRDLPPSLDSWDPGL